MQIADDRPADVKLYITDTTRVCRATGWSPRHTPRETLTSIHDWITSAESARSPSLGRVR